MTFLEFAAFGALVFCKSPEVLLAEVLSELALAEITTELFSAEVRLAPIASEFFAGSFSHIIDYQYLVSPFEQEYLFLSSPYSLCANTGCEQCA